MFIIARHGERADLHEEESKNVKNMYDPHITVNGKEYSEKTGSMIKNFLLNNNQSPS